MQRLLLCAMVTTTLSACVGPQNDIHVLPKDVETSADDSAVECQGRWEESEPSFSPMSKVNAVIIRCTKAAMQCQEAVAQVTTPGDKLPTTGLFVNSLFTYTVTSWRSGIVKASAETRALDLQ